jgi:hypothetical protein
MHQEQFTQLINKLDEINKQLKLNNNYFTEFVKAMGKSEQQSADVLATFLQGHKPQKEKIAQRSREQQARMMQAAAEGAEQQIEEATENIARRKNLRGEH